MAPAFHPAIFGDFFINNVQPSPKESDEWMEERVDQLVEEVGRMLEVCKDDVVKQMNLVDVLQRLGIDHHFEEQIDTILKNIHRAEFNSSDLYEVALRFRLLRKQGYWVSPDEFNKFKAEDGSFSSDDITNDPKGLLSLYNAAHLLTHNEKALEEAILFARHHLQLLRGNLAYPLDEQVTRALEIPLPRTMKRVEVLNYIFEYSAEEKMFNPSILELAVLDFNILQKVHQNELKEICQWWENLSSDIRLDYVRERVVECYFCAYAAYYEKEHARARMIFAKRCMLFSLLDDTYDVRATLEEARKFNDALQRWDKSDVSLLPEDLKRFFLSIISNFREFEDELEPHEKYLQILSSNFLQEAEWFHQNYIPCFTDHVTVSLQTGGAIELPVSLIVGMGDIATKEVLDWALANPDAGRAFAEVARFMDDLAASHSGRDKMDVASTVECYMNEHGVTREVAEAKIAGMAEDGWKSMNQIRFKHRAFLPFVQRIANLCMSATLLYHGKKNGFSNSLELKDMFESHFVNPIPLNHIDYD
uniref:Sesquiterpene synthase n=1 Tax=Oryza sativa subsp. japonica TaxID=39947 RepID=Q8GVL6_ORYSJ|nr:putative sesquiterpene synthase [Oryza sativa Japonica Group]